MEVKKYYTKNLKYSIRIFLFFLSVLAPMLSLAEVEVLKYAPPVEIGDPMTATVTFQQIKCDGDNADAVSVSKVTLKYFTSTDCSGNAAGVYSTLGDAIFPINTSTTFGLNATSAYIVGSTKLSLVMSNMHSIAVVLKSTSSNIPQAPFTGSCGINPSFCCVRVDCSSGTKCIANPSIGTQKFQLKNNAAIGDYADGGVIACMDGELNNLIVPLSDNSKGIVWGDVCTSSLASSVTDGAANTNIITSKLGAGSYAAKTCSTYATTGGFTNGWFLPASTQLNCIYKNKKNIGGFVNNLYWGSTEECCKAVAQHFDKGVMKILNKNNRHRVRCAHILIK